MLRRAAMEAVPVVEQVERIGASGVATAYDGKPPCWEEFIGLVRCLERFERAVCKDRYSALKECLGYTDSVKP